MTPFSETVYRPPVAPPLNVDQHHAEIVAVREVRDCRSSGDRDGPALNGHLTRLRAPMGRGGGRDGIVPSRPHPAIWTGADVEAPAGRKFDGLVGEFCILCIERSRRRRAARASHSNAANGVGCGHGATVESVRAAADGDCKHNIGWGCFVADNDHGPGPDASLGNEARRRVGASPNLDGDIVNREIQSRGDINRLLDRRESATGRVRQTSVAVAAIGAHIVGAVGRQKLADLARLNRRIGLCQTGNGCAVQRNGPISGRIPATRKAGSGSQGSGRHCLLIQNRL